jgi:hypothetical protein
MQMRELDVPRLQLSSLGVFMRVATFVLGVSMLLAGGVSGASETMQSPSAHRAAAVLADGVMSAPTGSQFDRGLAPNAMLYARDSGVRSGLAGAMGFIPAQNPASFLRASTFGEPRMSQSNDRFDPGRIPLPATRSMEDHMLTGFVAVMLIAYQLRRKHRFLRPHQFST